MKLCLSRLTLSTISLIAIALAAGCASPHPNADADDEAQSTDDAMTSSLTAFSSIRTTQVYFSPRNVLTTTAAEPVAYGLLEVQPKASFRLELRNLTDGTKPLGFKLYRRNANGKLSHVRTVNVPGGVAKTTFKSTSGGSYVIAATAPEPATFVLAVTCTSRNGQCALPGQPGALCGVRGAAACDDGIACIFDADAACGEADLPGTCHVPNEICPLEYYPVCGCDSVTYASACEAHKAGVSVAIPDHPCPVAPAPPSDTRGLVLP